MSPDPAETYRRAMPPGTLLEFPITGLDRVGVPTWAAAWAGTSTFSGGVGYGADDAAARVSAWGEASEAVLMDAAAADMGVRRGSYAEVLAAVGDGGVVDPLTLCLEAGSDYGPDRALDWVAMRRWATGEQVLVPVEFVASDEEGVPAEARATPPGGRLVTMITNGQGAGDSVERAVGHALGELLQRDGNGLRFRAMDTGVVVDLGPGDSLVQDPQARWALQTLRAGGVDVIVKLAAVQHGVVNLVVVGTDDDPAQPVMVTAGGEAAHPDRDVALRKAVLEFAAARARKAFMHGPLEPVLALAPPTYGPQFVSDPAAQEPRALREMLAWVQMGADELRGLMEPVVFARRSSVSFADLPTAPGLGVADVCGRQVAALADDGLDVLVLLAHRGDAVAAKVVVPGLEVETMSYARIGERGVRDLLGRGDGRTGLHGLVGLGPAPEGAARVLLSAEAEERVGGRPWLDRRAVDRVIGRLYPLYREPGRHAAAAALSG